MKNFTVSVEVKSPGLICLVCFFPPFYSFLYFLCPPPHFFQPAFSFFTLKYAKYLEGYSTDGMRHIYKKACITHLPRKPAIHLLWAAFEEQQGGCEQLMLWNLNLFLGVHLYWQFAFFVFNQVMPRKPVESWSPWRPRFQVWRWCVSGGLALNVGTATWLKLRPY